MKGIELPINVLIIIAVALVVLLGIIALYFSGFNPFSTTIGLESVKNDACRELVQQYRCDRALNLIQTEGFDADKDGNVGETAALGDNLDKLCENFYNAANDNTCKKICGCPSY